MEAVLQKVVFLQDLVIQLKEDNFRLRMDAETSTTELELLEAKLALSAATCPTKSAMNRSYADAAASVPKVSMRTNPKKSTFIVEPKGGDTHVSKEVKRNVRDAVLKNINCPVSKISETSRGIAVEVESDPGNLSTLASSLPDLSVKTPNLLQFGKPLY